MAYSQADLDAVSNAIAKLIEGRSVVRVTVENVTTEYRQADMAALRGRELEIRQELARAEGGTHVRAVSMPGKGL